MFLDRETAGAHGLLQGRLLPAVQGKQHSVFYLLDWQDVHDAKANEPAWLCQAGLEM